MLAGGAIVVPTLITLGNFSGVTAAQVGVAGSTEQDRGLASALYFSAYYLAGAIGSYLPGLAFQRWEWTGVAGLCLGAYAIGVGAVLRSRRVAVIAQAGAGERQLQH